MRRHRYHVEVRIGVGSWQRMAGSEGSRDYVDGWCDCADSHYPAYPMRAVRDDGFVVRETVGRSGVTVPTEKRP